MARTFKCEWCGEDKQFRYRHKVAGHIICSQCDGRKSDNFAPKIQRFFTWSPIRKPQSHLKKEEKEVLDKKYTKQGLTQFEKDTRITTLNSNIKKQRKVTIAKKHYDKAHPDFKKGFSELTQRKKRD